MKHLLRAVAVALTIFAWSPSGLAARTAAASNCLIGGISAQPVLTNRSSAMAQESIVGPASSGTLLAQAETPEGPQNMDNPGDDNGAADADNQNGADADQNGEANNGSDSDQSAQADDPNAQADDNGDNAGQDPGYANDSQADNGGDSNDSNPDNSTSP